MKGLIILKIGGSLITDKASTVPKPNLGTIKRLSKEISKAYSSSNFKLVLVHGAGSYGHPIVKRTGIDKGIKTKKQILDFAETQMLQNELNLIFVKHLIEAGLPAMPCQASASALMRNGKLQNMDIDAIKEMLKLGLVPVLYGVPACDIAQGCSILSGDGIAPYIAEKLGADRVIHATTVDGVYTSDPNIDKAAKRIREISNRNFNAVKKLLGGSLHIDVTGGMLGKITELKGAGIEAWIISGLGKGNVFNALTGKNSGTKINL